MVRPPYGPSQLHCSERIVRAWRGSLQHERGTQLNQILVAPPGHSSRPDRARHDRSKPGRGDHSYRPHHTATTLVDDISNGKAPPAKGGSQHKQTRAGPHDEACPIFFAICVWGIRVWNHSNRLSEHPRNPGLFGSSSSPTSSGQPYDHGPCAGRLVALSCLGRPRAGPHGLLRAMTGRPPNLARRPQNGHVMGTQMGRLPRPPQRQTG